MMENSLAEHNCIICLLHRRDYSELCTFGDLVAHIEEQKEFNRSLDDDPVLRNANGLRAKVWGLKSYGDKRKSTDITRFNYCPSCGKLVDWKAIREKGRED